MMLENNKYKNYSKRQEVTEVIENFGDLEAYNSHFPMTLEDMPKKTKKIKAQLKKLEKTGKVYIQIWFGINPRCDGYGDKEYELVLKGKRPETNVELQNRMDRILITQLNNLAGSIIDIRYWLSPEGKEELKAMKANFPIWLKMLTEIEEAKLKCFQEK